MEYKVPEVLKDSKNIVAAGLATSLAAVAFAGMPERAQASVDFGTRGAGTELTTGKEASVNPFKVSEKLIFDINNNPEAGHPNIVDTGALLFKPGTFVNTGPVPSLEKSKQHLPGTSTVKSGEAILVQLPRLVHYANRDWAVGFLNDGKGGSAIRSRNMRWFDLKTAKYDTYGYTSHDSPTVLRPEVQPVNVNPDGDLQLLDPFSFEPSNNTAPAIFQLMVPLKGEKVIKAQLDYIGLQNLHGKYKPRVR